MNLWTVDDNDFSISHLEKYPLWATTDGGAYEDEQVNIALNNEQALEVAYGPYSVFVNFSFASGLEFNGYILVSELECEPYYISIWTGKEFCSFNKHMSKSSSLGMEMKALRDSTGKLITLQDVFPINYKLRLPDELIAELDLTSEGVFTLPH